MKNKALKIFSLSLIAMAVVGCKEETKKEITPKETVVEVKKAEPKTEVSELKAETKEDLKTEAKEEVKEEVKAVQPNKEAEVKVEDKKEPEKVETAQNLVFEQEKKDFESILRWGYKQSLRVSKANLALMESVKNIQKEGGVEALKVQIDDFLSMVRELRRELEALDVKSDKMKSFKEDNIESFTLSQVIIEDSLNLMTAPNEELQKRLEINSKQAVIKASEIMSKQNIYMEEYGFREEMFKQFAEETK